MLLLYLLWVCYIYISLDILYSDLEQLDSMRRSLVQRSQHVSFVSMLAVRTDTKMRHEWQTVLRLRAREELIKTKTISIEKQYSRGICSLYSFIFCLALTPLFGMINGVGCGYKCYIKTFNNLFCMDDL